MTDIKSNDDCEKQRLIQDEVPQSVPIQHESQRSFRDRLFRHVLPCILLLLSVSILFRKAFVCHGRYTPGTSLHAFGDGEEESLDGRNIRKVALEAHIMSKCPDAAYCLQNLVVPAMAEASNKVNFTLSYIGSVNPDSHEIECMHGPGECLGNIIELCVAREYPDPLIYLGFANCLSLDYSDIPQRPLVEGCALEHGIDFNKLNKCISDEGKGADLLKRSIEHSQAANVSISCTVRVEGQVYCVRDGNQWKDCPDGSSVRDLVAQIDLLYMLKNTLQ